MLDLLRETKEIKKHIMEYNFHMRMDTVDISDYLPFNSDDEIKNFMMHDNEWIQRKKESV